MYLVGAHPIGAMAHTLATWAPERVLAIGDIVYHKLRSVGSNS